MIFGDLLHDGSVALDRPTLGWSVFRTGTECYVDRALWSGTWSAYCRLRASQVADAGEKLLGLMECRVKLPVEREGLVQQTLASVDLPADAARDAGQPDL